MQPSPAAKPGREVGIMENIKVIIQACFETWILARDVDYSPEIAEEIAQTIKYALPFASYEVDGKTLKMSAEGIEKFILNAMTNMADEDEADRWQWQTPPSAWVYGWFEGGDFTDNKLLATDMLPAEELCQSSGCDYCTGVHAKCRLNTVEQAGTAVVITEYRNAE